MGYKVNGVEVITDGRELINITGSSSATIVNNSFPVDGAVNVGNGAVAITLRINIPSLEAFDKAQWMIATDPTFATGVIHNEIEDIPNKLYNNFTTNFSTNTTYYFRVRVYTTAEQIWTGWSTPTSFTTAASNLLTSTIGASFGGGYYIGVHCGYYLIAAPNSTGLACCQWKTTNTTTPNTQSFNDGYANTYSMNETTHPAAYFTATRTIGGYNDWYLASKDELNVMYTNKNSMPGGEGFCAESYWSSSEYGAGAAWAQVFGTGNQGNCFKTCTYRVRAVRREQI